MCGIGAIFDPADASRRRGRERMVEALRHRGPDGDAVRRIGPVALAHTRLAIIDVAGGDQPLDSEDGARHRGRQRRDLQPRASCAPSSRRAATASRRTRTARWSSTPTRSTALDCVRHLNGIFAFALWDDREQRLVAARDAFGVKPLYWCTDGRRTGRGLRGRRA